MHQSVPDEDAVTMGSLPRRNYTPMEPAFACLADSIRHRIIPVISIGVGDIKDYTGKYSQTEGSAITQGGTLMVYSALGKLGNTVQVHERFDTRIAELELAYTDKRQLGDGRTHATEAGKPAVPWMPYFGGTILRSQYYIVGGITEVNYNIQSGGGELGVNGVGGKRRTYTMNVGVDLRVVDTRTLVVLKTVSLQKQIKGHELGAGVYRFFGTNLFDINIGAKNHEPMQLAVRTTIEQGVLELMGALGGVDAEYCVSQAIEYRAGEETVARPRPRPLPPKIAPVVGQAAPAAVPGVATVATPVATAVATPMVTPTQVPMTATTPAVAAIALPDAAPAATAAKPAGNGSKGKEVLDPSVTQSGLPPQNAGGGSQGATPQILFEISSAGMSSQAMSIIEQMATRAGSGQSVTFQLIGRDNEVSSPNQRREMSNQRVKVVSDALAARGINPSRIGVTWLPDPLDPGIVRHGAGYQLLVTMVISK